MNRISHMQAVLQKQKRAFIKEGAASPETRIDRLTHLYYFGNDKAEEHKVLDHARNQ